MRFGEADDEVHILSLDEGSVANTVVFDAGAVDWPRVRRSRFLVHQKIEYCYPGPIRELEHRLLVVPPARHGDQRRLSYHLDVSADDARIRPEYDRFGNLVLGIDVPYIPQHIAFDARVVLERDASYGRNRFGRSGTRGLLAPSRRTTPDTALRRAAAELRASGDVGLALANRICDWTYRAISYSHDATDVFTDAAAALRIGAGVCQDYAHIMLSLCRLCRLPARYVSGHLVGEGGTHAWTEVLLPDENDSGEVVAWPFDPTHNRLAGPSYVTIAVGRDYADVPPTSGSYCASYSGSLDCRKRVGVTDVEYALAG